MSEQAAALWNKIIEIGGVQDAGPRALQPAIYKAIDAVLAEVRADALEEAAKQAEDFGHSNGRVRASHKHVAVAIRALKSKPGRLTMPRKKKEPVCSFCGLTAEDTELLIEGTKAWICVPCVNTCLDIIAEEKTQQVLERYEELEEKDNAV